MRISKRKFPSVGNASIVPKNILKIIDCGFASTEVICWNRAKDRIYWHKGKGFLGVINLRELDEITYGDSISGSKI